MMTLNKFCKALATMDEKDFDILDFGDYIEVEFHDDDEIPYANPAAVKTFEDILHSQALSIEVEDNMFPVYHFKNFTVKTSYYFQPEFEVEFVRQYLEGKEK